MLDSSPGNFVEAARAMRPQICAARENMDRYRRLPRDLAHALDATGAFRLFLPASMGGPQLDPITAFKMVEELSWAEGSVGWCALLSNGGALFTGSLPAEVGRSMFGLPPNFRSAGSFRPEGTARLADGGYRVSGRWDYGSGIDHASWVFVNCKIADADGPVLTPSGGPATVMLFVPVEAVTIYDTWEVVGLCGTGSNDFEIDDVFVPAERTFRLYDTPHEAGFLYHPRTMLTAIWVLVAAVALGIARGAMDAFIELATQAGTTISTTLLRDRPPIREKVGEAEAIISGARAFVLDAVGTAWQVFDQDMPRPSPELTRARLAITHSIHEAVRAVDLLFHAAGTNAIHKRNGLERRFRDIHVVMQHGAGLRSNYESGGLSVMGRPPQDPGW